MTISKMDGNLYDYGNLSKIRGNYNQEALRNIPEPVKETEENLSAVSDAKTSEIKAPKILAEGQLEDFAFDFKKNKEFSMVGEDSRIENLDLEKNVADSRKDELLDQYRYFVGGENTSIQYASPDGVVTRVNR